MKKFFSVISLIVIIMLFSSGCGDDDCPVCPQFTQTGVAIGFIYANSGQLYASGEIMGIEGLRPEIDSIIIDTMSAYTGMAMAGPEVVYFSLHQWPSGYASGDTIRISFYTPTGVSTASIKIMNYPDDNINLISPEPAEIFALNTSVTVEWNEIENADWYNIEFIYQYLDSTATQVSDVISSCQTDTTYIFPGSALDYDGYLNMRITAGNGPRPDSDEGNITGGSIKGAIFSQQMIGTYFQIGDGLPVGAASPAVYVEDNIDAEFLKAMADLFIK